MVQHHLESEPQNILAALAVYVLQVQERVVAAVAVVLPDRRAQEKMEETEEVRPLLVRQTVAVVAAAPITELLGQMDLEA